MRTLVYALPILLGLAASSRAVAEPLWEREWVEVRTEHFVVASALPQERSIELAVELENFRAAARLLTNIGRFEERVPTKVYMLPQAVPELGFDGKINGYFLPGLRANYAVVMPSGAESDEVLKHEYVHFLIHNRGAQLYPTWMDEGFAEVLSTLRVNGQELEYGKPMTWRATSLLYDSWMPFASVLALRDTGSLSRDRGAMFYGQAWILMHYLMIGRKDAHFTEQASAYLQRVENGEPSAQAFETAFGLTVRSLQTKLVRYARKFPYYRGKLAQPFPAVEPRVRRMNTDEIAAALGGLAFQCANLAAAQEYFDAALAANPNNGLALVGVADLHREAKRYDAAATLYEKAIALEPGNANHELDYGEYFLTRANLSKKPEAAREFRVEARRHFARSYKIDPNNPETLDQNGLTYLFEGEEVAKGVESLELAHDLLPSQPRIRADLAKAYVAAGKPEKARVQLRQLLAWSHSTQVEWVQQQLASLGPDPNETAEASAPVNEQP